MTALSIQPTFPTFSEADGSPLEDGYIWIGTANLNPITNPIAVFWDAALTLPAAQPIRTIGGYPVNSGTPARLYVNSDYSIQVQNRNGSVVYSAPAATERYGNLITFADITGTLGSDRVSFLQAGTGAVTRTAQSKLRDVVSVKDFGAVGDGVADDQTAFNNAAATGKAYIAPNGTYKRGTDVQRMALAAFKTVTTDEAVDGKFMEWVEVTNPTAKTGYAIRYAYNNHIGNVSSGLNEISDTLLTRFSSIQSGFAWGRWDVMMSPLPFGSGLTGAPSVAQSYFTVTSEVNPQNRGGDPGGWQPENRLWSSTIVGGEQMVAETQDFTGTLGTNRLGYNITFGYAVAKSPFTSNWGGSFEHAKFYNATLVNPNAIAFGGFAHFATGFKPYPISVSVASAGSGYTVGDILTFNTGLSQSLNENSQVKVLAVNGSGGVTSAELWVAGSYVTAPSFPQTVTGGTGSGATFNATMATFGSVSPRAFAGISGRWLYGIDFCPNPSQRYASCDNGAIRLPNGSTNGIVARNSGDTTDVNLVFLGSNNLVYVGGQAIQSRLAWTPTITSDAGSLTTVTIGNARWSQADGIVYFQLNLQIVNKGTATGAFRFTLPTNASAHSFVCTGMNVSSGYTLNAFCNSGGSNVVRCTRYDGADPMNSGDFYSVTGFYEAATP